MEDKTKPFHLDTRTVAKAVLEKWDSLTAVALQKAGKACAYCYYRRPKDDMVAVDTVCAIGAAIPDDVANAWDDEGLIGYALFETGAATSDDRYWIEDLQCVHDSVRITDLRKMVEERAALPREEDQ